MRENYFVTFCDALEPWQYGIQDSATLNMEGMLFFHNYLVFFIWFIAFAVFWLFYKITVDFNDGVRYNSITFTHSSVLEVIWTIVPAVTLVLLTIPSFVLLYSLDELIHPVVTFKHVGHQWYWSYEFSDIDLLKDIATLNFDSYMSPVDSLNKGAFRLLEIDNIIVLPGNTQIRIIVMTQNIYNSLSVKVEGTPGRLIQDCAIFFSQSMDIRGVNHGFTSIFQDINGGGFLIHIIPSVTDLNQLVKVKSDDGVLLFKLVMSLFILLQNGIEPFFAGISIGIISFGLMNINGLIFPIDAIQLEGLNQTIVNIVPNIPAVVGFPYTARQLFMLAFIRQYMRINNFDDSNISSLLDDII